MKLSDHFLGLEPIFWDYYHGDRPERKLKNPFAPDGNHIQFIEEYFKIAGKSILIWNFPVDVFQLKRPAHVNSTFFLGLLIIKECKIDIGLTNKNLPGYSTLPFLWFLATLFHDFAEQLEQQEDFLKTVTDVNSLLTRYQVQHNLLQQQIPYVPPSIFKSIEKYFDLRRAENKVDHGIHAGIYLFDALVKNRIQKNIDGNDNHLWWHPSLDNQYVLASASVAIHNIWVAQKELDYLKFNLKELKHFQGYSADDFPFSYIFGLVDTIDPVKFFCYPRDRQPISVENLLESISFDFNGKSIIIKNESLPQEDFIEYDRKIRRNLKNWLNQKITRRRNILKLEIL